MFEYDRLEPFKEVKKLDFRNKYRILVVDDIEDNLRILGYMLLHENLGISIASSGNIALKILEKKQIDLILLDISMPEMDGFELCSILKKDEKYKEIPVIFLTALREPEVILKGFELGAVDFVSKPFNKSELIARVVTHLQLKNARDIIQKQKKILQNKNSILQTQKNTIENQHNDIISSIRYAKIIQKAVLPGKDIFDLEFPSNFILNLPRDIVSGDFYWFGKFQNLIIIAVADCTGHGVPGAFMSMLGISLLNETLNNLDSCSEITAANILNILRKRLKKALQQNTIEKSIRDGMDMSLLIINRNTMKGQYAGANNSIFIITKNEENGTSELIEYLASKMPVSVESPDISFENNFIDLQKVDSVYMFTDGLADQFGGENDKKFLKKRFKKLIIEIKEKQMSEQKEIILEAFNNWKNDNEQVDDVLVLGIKI